jgi:hypothetical protein
VATPLALVVAKAELNVPQLAPLSVNETGSLALPAPLTVAVIVEVLVPFAAIVVGLAVVTVVLVPDPFWVITVEALLPFTASVPVTVQKPTVRLAV